MKSIDQKTLEKIWDKVPVDYYDLGVKKNLGQKIWHLWKLSSIKKATRNLSPSLILDVGSNSGTLTAKIAQLFPHTKMVAVDVHQKAIAFAKKKHPKINFRVADAQKLPFKDGSFDLIFCLETLEHIVSPQKALSEMRRCLKPEGFLIISMDSGSLLFKIVWFFWIKFGRGRVWDESHLWPFNRKRLKEMIIREKFISDKEILTHFGMGVTLRIKPK